MKSRKKQSNKDKGMPQSIEKQFLRIYEKNADAIFRHCYFRISDREKAYDLTQETFSRTWKHLAAGNNVENLKAFMFRVANNLLIDEYRKKNESSLEYVREKGYEPEDNNPVNSVKTKTDIALLIKYLDELEEKYREVVVMRYIDDMSIKEIAEILEESENNVSVRIHRGINKLKDVIQKQ